ncbi:MAG: sulfite exporter TauE/SafE family protein [Betaproteobacteria bacterium]|nr:sulfite exporter TauE/SafE family protein [Betaproteobacteria bacterium]
MDLPFDTLASAALIIVLAYTVFGLTGFGSSITAMPLLAQLFPLRFAVPLMLLLDLCATTLLGLKNRKVVDRRELLRLIPYMFAGMVLGVTLLVNAPERALLLLLGCFVLVYAGWSLLFQRGVNRTIATGWAAPLGVAGGIFTALFGTGGPLYIVYLAGRLHDKLALRATIGVLIFVSGISRLVLFSTAGLYAQANLLLLGVMLLPCALLGLYIGSRLHRHLPAQRVVQAVWVILILGGSSLIWRSLWG